MTKIDLMLTSDSKMFIINKFREETNINETGKKEIVLVPYQKKEFKIKNIKSIIFGPMHSRLWMFRKAINLVPRDKMEELKFKSWQCLTIQLST